MSKVKLAQDGAPLIRMNYDYVQFVGLDCSDSPSMTKQSFREECDINNILERYQVTGLLPHLIEQEPSYGDFSDAPTYQESFEIVRKAQEQFTALDAHLRARFDHDPANFLAFCSDPANRDEMFKLGLMKKEAAKAAPAPSSSQAGSTPQGTPGVKV